jgi:hypothetical protein
MQRSSGVTAVAVVALIGGALACLFGLLMVLASAVIRHAPGPAQNTPAAPVGLILALEALLFLGVGAWAIASGIGLLRLKNWARISILVLGGLLAGFAFFGLFGAVMVTIMPMPTPPGREVPHGFMAAMGAIMAAWCLIQMAVGIWWLVFLNRKAVKEQFLGEGVTQAVGGRPVSITVIAWLMTVSGAISLPYSVVTSSPAWFLGMIIHGWLGKVVLLLFSLAILVIGILLLRLKPYGRTFAVWSQVFGVFNGAVSFLLPGASARFNVLTQEIARKHQVSFPVLPSSVLWVGFAIGTLAAGLQLYFLITRKEAYLRAAAARAQQGAQTS